MRCPVCQTECYKSAICPECGFDNLSPVSLSTEDSEDWIKNVVWPWRRKYWKTLDDFEIEGTEIKKFSGTASTVTIPYGIERIGEKAFYRNTWIQEAFFPETVSLIGSHAFAETRSLSMAIFPDSLEKIGSGAFEGSGLLSVSIPPNCKEIEYGAFKWCHNLKHIYISNGVKGIGMHAFDGCVYTETAIIPMSVQHIGPGAFSDVLGRLTFFVDPRNEFYCVKNGCLIDRKEGKIVVGSSKNEMPSDPDIHTIGYEAYFSVRRDTLLIPSNIKKIEDRAFHLGAISKIFLPKTVSVVCCEAFYSFAPHVIQTITPRAQARTAIYCEHEAKPVHWDKQWCSPAQNDVAWGKQWNVVDGHPELILLHTRRFCVTLVSYFYKEDRNSLKMTLRFRNNSNEDVHFIVNYLSLDCRSALSSENGCLVHANGEKTREYTCGEDDFYDNPVLSLYRHGMSRVSFELSVEDDIHQCVLEPQKISLLGLYEPKF